jgi:hypothetical protein
MDRETCPRCGQLLQPRWDRMSREFIDWCVSCSYESIVTPIEELILPSDCQPTEKHYSAPDERGRRRIECWIRVCAVCGQQFESKSSKRDVCYQISCVRKRNNKIQAEFKRMNKEKLKFQTQQRRIRLKLQRLSLQ